MKKNSIVNEYLRQYVGGRIIGGNGFVGEWVADIKGKYIAYRLAGRAHRFDGVDVDRFSDYLWRKGYDITEEVCGVADVPKGKTVPIMDYMPA